MTPEQAQHIIDTLARGVSLTTASYLALFGFWILGMAASAAIGGFFGQRAKTAAIERDLETITEQLRRTTEATEAIKTRLSGELWVDQSRWQLKRDVYASILPAIDESVP